MPSSSNLPTRATPSGIRAGVYRSRPGGTATGIEPDPPHMASPTQRANRRKLFVFLGVFAIASAASLSYTFGRPAEYRASARVQINPGAMQVESIKPAGGSQAADAPKSFLTELQVLTSRPVLETTAERLTKSLGSKMALLGPDPIARMQSSFELSPAGGTDVVELAATGADPELVAGMVNGVIATYKERLDQAYRDSSIEALAQINDEVAKLHAKVLAKRRSVEEFRIKNNVVSLEREENQVLSRVRGSGTALNNAHEKLSLAEGKVRSLEESIASGKSVVRARDNPTLAHLEQRVSQIREDLREQERSYTPQYLEKDNRYRSQRARIAELEKQIVAQRQSSQRASLAEAEEDLASAREAVSRIEQKIASDRGAVQAFTSRFNEYKGLREELTLIESLYRDTTQRKAKLEAGERARRPFVKVVEAAQVPQEVWRPLYMRDAAISVGGSFLLALLIMWVVEIFNRSDPQPTLLVPQPMPYPAMGRQWNVDLPNQPTLAGEDARPAIEAGPSGLLAATSASPRELTPDEITVLLGAATDEVRLAALLLLSGLSLEELTVLRWDDIDVTTREIRVGGTSPRVLELQEPTRHLIERLPRKPGAPVLAIHGDAPPTTEDLTSDLLGAAHDAGIDRPAEVSPAALRHTYVAFLMRQGIRFADLVKLVGRLPPEQAAAYSAFAPSATRINLSEVNRVMAGVPDAEIG